MTKNELAKLSEAYYAFNKIRHFLESVSNLAQARLQVVETKPDFIECHARDFGGDFTEDVTDGLAYFVQYELLPQCGLNDESYELVIEEANLVHMRIAGRTISFFTRDCDKDTNDPYGNLMITFKLDRMEYSDFLSIASQYW